MLSNLLLFIFSGLSLAAADASIREYRQAHEYQIITELMEFVRYPNVANNLEDIKKNADVLMQMMVRRGLKPKLLGAKGKDVPPSVFAEIITPGAKRTIMLYAHYDGVAVNPDKWTVTKPFEPIVVEHRGSDLITIPFAKPPQLINPEWRIYGRSTSDDKGGVIAILTALDAVRVGNLKLTSNIKLFFEGEEEQASPNLESILTDNKDLLSSDMWVILDGPGAITGQNQAVFGVRGVKWIDITVYGANRALHSGHFGNWASNPSVKLSRLIASMIDDSGKVTIDNYYDDVEPLGPMELQAVKEASSTDGQIQEAFGICRPDGDGRGLYGLIAQPSLNVRGLSGGEVGEKAANIIPSSATASLDMRLVRGNDVIRQPRKLIEHVKKQGYYIIEVDESKGQKDREPTAQERKSNALIAKIRLRSGGYNAERLSMENPLANQLIAAIQSVRPTPIRKIPTFGGSLPLNTITQVLGSPQIDITMNNYDNNQHAENENLRIQNLWDGIEIVAAMMTMK